MRWGGRYQVFPQVASEAYRFRARSAPDAVVDVWNGMPFFSPLWFHGPRLAILHHVHAEMWRMTLKPAYAAIGDAIERQLAPLALPHDARRHAVGVLSRRDRRAARAAGAPRPRRRAGRGPALLAGRAGAAPSRSSSPSAASCPVKRYDVLFAALAEARASSPDAALRRRRRGLRAAAPRGRAPRARRRGLDRAAAAVVDDRALLALYRSAWVVASSSLREGWGMTLTEAAACATPAVATDIAGHRDAVVDGETGLLVGDDAELGAALAKVLADDALRTRLGRAARRRAEPLTWPRTAAGLFSLLDGGAVPDVGARRSGA